MLLFAEAAGHRAYFKETLDITKCHQDVLHGNWYGLLLKYVATYAPKFSDSFAREWLNDEASAFSVARRVLFDYQPHEPEMWLYIFAELLPPCTYGGTMVPLLVPCPDSERLTVATQRLVDAYETSKWRSDSMSFLEFCRKTNDKGAIHQWVVRQWKASSGQANDGSPSLEEFANTCPMKGEKLMACDMLLLFNDRWFGQWLALRKPFRSLDALLRADIVDQARFRYRFLMLSVFFFLTSNVFHFVLPVATQVPVQYKHFANTTQQCPDYWTDEDKIRADLELEAVGNDKIETFLAMVRAQHSLVDRFLSGQLSKEDDAGLQAAMVDVGLVEGEEDPMFQGVEFNREQKRFEKGINKLLDRAKRGRLAENDSEWEAVVEEAYKENKPQFVTGPPGTGKTTVLDKCVRRCLREGGNVLYALPTAQQASRVRAKHPQADVDTCSGAFFLYRDAVEVMDCLTRYDLVAVDEVSQLSQSDFERIIQMWEAADKMPALVFAGDFWQLPGFSRKGTEPSKATDSPRWSMLHHVKLHEMWRCKDEVLKKKLEALRTAEPSRKQLRDICMGHKAWSGYAEPTAWDLQQLYRNHPNTIIATCTRRAAALPNRSGKVIFCCLGNSCFSLKKLPKS